MSKVRRKDAKQKEERKDRKAALKARKCVVLKKCYRI